MTEKNDQEVIDELPEVKEGEEDKTDWKALAQKNQGIAKRLKTKNTKLGEELASKPKPKVKKLKSEKKVDTDKFDYAQKSFLIANGIKGADEHQLALDMLKKIGDLDKVVEDEYFMHKLKELREAKAVNDATPPSDSSRPSSSPKDEAGYWIAKGEMPADTPENRELRQKVVNARLKSQTDGDKFSSEPVVGGQRK